MNRLAAVATLVVIVHHGIAFVHGAAHEQLAVGLDAWQQVFVWVVITILPIVSLILYWTRFKQAAALILFSSMLAGLLFGVYFHFIASTPDHVSHLPDAEGRGLFVATAVLLVPFEGLAAAFGLWSWLKFRKPAV
jgi:Na+/proline symporter